MKYLEFEERPWGSFYVIHDEPTYKLKRIEVLPNKRLSYQYHNKRAESWTIVKGSGRVTIKGTCSVCQKRNQWKDVKLFSSSFLACKYCGQKYNVALADKFLKNIDNNLKKLLKKYGKVAIWGINYHTADLFKNSQVFKDKGIYPLEISEIKRKMDLYGRQINTPQIISLEKIEVVIISIPAYSNEIAERIKKNYKKVKLIIDVCKLVNPNFKEI